MKKHILILVLIIFLITMIGFKEEQNNNYYNVLMYKNNEQRTGFYDTKGVPVLHGIKWKYGVKGRAHIGLLYKGILFFSCSSIPNAINSETGKKEFEPSFFSFCVFDNLIIGYEYLKENLDRKFSAWNFNIGKKVWENDNIKSTTDFILHKDILYVYSHIEGGEDYRNVIYLVNPMTGEIIEEIELSEDSFINGIAFWKDNLIYTTIDGLYLIDFSVTNKKHSPVKIFETREGSILKKGQTEAEKNLTQTIPVISNNCVYFGDYIGNFFAFNLITRKLKWERKFNTSFYSDNSASIYDGIVYLCNDGGIYYLDEKNGNIIFKKENIDAAGSNAIAITKDGIYFSTSNGMLYALDRKTGKELWSLRLAKNCVVSPIISNGVIYIPAYDTLEKGWIFAIY